MWVEGANIAQLGTKSNDPKIGKNKTRETTNPSGSFWLPPSNSKQTQKIDAMYVYCVVLHSPGPV